MKKEKWLNKLTIILIFGILLMSLGVFLVGNHIPFGNVILVIASAIVYISILILAWKI
jgi:uncharacterized membrane-anchored protein YitT (DUF2179 family)